MLIEILSFTYCDGNKVKPGDVVDASPAASSLLVGTGKAKPAEEAPKKRGRKRAPVNRMVAEDEIENRDADE